MGVFDNVYMSALRLNQALNILILLSHSSDGLGMGTFQDRVSEMPADKNLTDLERLIQKHKELCRIEESCSLYQVSWDGECYCDYCSCEPDCVKDDTCCPDAVVNFWAVPEPDKTYQCWPTAYRFSEGLPYQLMVVDCPDTFINAEVTEKCRIRHDKPALSYALPVEDKTTRIIYANKYCAQCHSVPQENFVYWSTHIRCKSTTFTPQLYNTLLADINTTSDCDLVFRPQKFQYKKYCKKVISSCNETGLWQRYDNFTDQACRIYNSPYMSKYRNPFCALCNGYNVSRFKRATNCGVLIPGRVPFSALLDFRPEQEDEEKQNPVGKCSENQIYDSVSVSILHVSLRKHVYSNIFKILQRKKENFQKK